MIARLSGKILEKLPTRLVIEIGGVGFEVLISGKTYEMVPEVEADVSLNIYTHVREEEIKLIGFINQNDKDFFIKLITVSGISIKIALSSLSIYSSDELKKIIAKKEVDMLRRVPGIGKKLAERLIVELKDKIEEEGYTDIFHGDLYDNEKITEVKQALKTLGYKNIEIDAVLNKIKTDDLVNKKTEEILRSALKEM